MVEINESNINLSGEIFKRELREWCVKNTDELLKHEKEYQRRLDNLMVEFLSKE